jgi:hypothetical protein
MPELWFASRYSALAAYVPAGGGKKSVLEKQMIMPMSGAFVHHEVASELPPVTSGLSLS